MKHGQPWYKHYPADFLNGVQGLGPELIGAYYTIIDLLYARGGDMPRDDRHLAGVMGCSIRKARSLTDALIEAGKVSFQDGFIANSRVETELKRARSNHEARVKGGRNSAEKRAASNENKDIGSGAVQTPARSNKDTDTDKNPPTPQRGNIEKLRDQMWNEWPQESRKRTSRSKFLEKLSLALKRDGMTCEEMLGAFRHWLSEQNMDEGGQFVPNPERFFNAKFHLDHKGQTGPVGGGGGSGGKETAADRALRRAREIEGQQEGSAQPEHLFLAAGGMR